MRPAFSPAFLLAYQASAAEPASTVHGGKKDDLW
jgi:hypothetical protein